MNNELFKNKYRVPSIRLKGFDYGQNASFFVTVCTKDRNNYFGKMKPTIERTENWEDEFIYHNYLEKTKIGQIAIDFWKSIPLHHPYVKLDTFVVMPNHVHGILIFDKLANNPKPAETHCNASLPSIPFANLDSLDCINKFGPQSKNLSSVLRGYKAAVKTEAIIRKIDFSWQPRFHDRIIRNEEEYERIKNYILNNPIKWDSDTDNLLMHKYQ